MPSKRASHKPKAKRGPKGSARQPSRPATLNLRKALANLSPAEIYEHAVRNGSVQLTAAGPFNAVTTPHTGRSPLDKYVVREPATEKDVKWGKVNQPIDEATFERMHQKVVAYLNKRQALYTRDVFACAEPSYRMP
ncbi:MAG: phosphoenolpyruvate carboxykinase (ATP), partial [Anaerolineales bacterium]